MTQVQLRREWTAPVYQIGDPIRIVIVRCYLCVEFGGSNKGNGVGAKDFTIELHRGKHFLKLRVVNAGGHTVSLSGVNYLDCVPKQTQFHLQWYSDMLSVWPDKIHHVKGIKLMVA